MKGSQIDHEVYTYPLPAERIAKFPLSERDASKLLVYQDGKIRDETFLQVADFLPENSLLVLNNTRVVEARLFFYKPTGARIELFLLEPHLATPDISEALHQQGEVVWRCLVGGASKWKHGMSLHKKGSWNNQPVELTATISGQLSDCFLIQFNWTPAELDFVTVLHGMGSIPLPPYLKRIPEATDSNRYQTIYAQKEGSVAAPTAGLHFTPRVFDSLAKKNIQPTYITLHVGAGTFQPVKGTLAEHQMHAEYIDVEADIIEKLKKNPDIFSVGTTSLRTLESLFHLGVKSFLNPELSIEEMRLEQWEVYETEIPASLNREKALEALLKWMKKKGIDRLLTQTRLLIVPGYRFRMIRGLITNFHQPQSTLLLLVAAIIGEEWRNVYDHALKTGYRFLSYGDACLFFTE